MSTDKERNALSKAYPGYSWQDKVSKMSNEQVTAIYLRFKRDGWPNTEPKLTPNLKVEEPKPEPIQNEDQFRLF